MDDDRARSIALTAIAYQTCARLSWERGEHWLARYEYAMARRAVAAYLERRS